MAFFLILPVIILTGLLITERSRRGLLCGNWQERRMHDSASDLVSHCRGVAFVIKFNDSMYGLGWAASLAAGLFDICVFSCLI